MVSRNLIALRVIVWLLCGTSGFLAVPQVGAAQDAPKSVPQAESGARNSGNPISLDIYDFAMGEESKKSEATRDLPDAIADSLFLQFLGQPGLDVKRMHEAYQPPAVNRAVAPGNKAAESRTPERQSHYVLEGNIVFEEAQGVGLPATNGGTSRALFVTYRLHAPAQDSGAKPLVEGSVGTQLAYLSASLKQISVRAVAKLSPKQKIQLRIASLVLEGFPTDRKSFYAENLPDLMRSELLSEDFVAQAEEEGKADYTIAETASLHAGSYKLLATISSRNNSQKERSLEESGDEVEILAAQFRLSRKLVEALKTRKDLPSEAGQPKELSAEAYVKEADTYLTKDINTSISLYRRALELDPANVETKYSLSWAYMQSSQAEDALKLLQGKEVEASAHGQYFKSIAFSKLNDHDNAMGAANRAVDLARSEQPENLARCYSWRGRLFTAQGDTVKALSDYEAALKLNPKPADFYEDAAKANEKLGKYDQAVAVLDKGRKESDAGPRLALALNETRRRAASHYLDLNDDQQALGFALAAANEEPGSEYGQRLVGATYHRLKNFPKAETALNEALKLQETSDALAQMASLRLDQGKVDAARELAIKSIDKDPEDNGNAYSVLQQTANQSVAPQNVSYLRGVLKTHPRNQGALQAWDYIQVTYLLKDQSGVRALYAASDAALQGVEYKDWISGWSNMVELALISGNPERAVEIAQRILELKPTRDYTLPLNFYLWLIRMMQADWARAHAEWSSFVGDLRTPEANNLVMNWDFTGTRQFIEQRVGDGTVSALTRDKAEAAMKLLAASPLQRSNINRFLATFPEGNETR
jgi:tetratricopeptide (TPR) repeat protein